MSRNIRTIARRRDYIDRLAFCQALHHTDPLARRITALITSLKRYRR